MELVVPAKPEPFRLDIERSALIVVDMQNAFCKKGGMVDVLRELRETQVERVIEINKKVIEASRHKGIKVVYLRMTYRPDMSNVGGPESPNYWKESGAVAMHKHPEWKGRFLTVDTWDWEIIDELRPQPEDIVVNKSRYSGFANTELDIILKTYKIKHLLFLGLATNICVESSLRDASHLQYLPVLVTDAVAASHPSRQQSSIDNIREIFGWVTDSKNVLDILKV